MKNINQLIKNPYLKQNEEVKELINYCLELEEQLIELKQDNKFSFEDKLTSLVREIYSDINHTIKHNQEIDRFNLNDEKIDFEVGVKNLKEYLEDFGREYGFRF